MPEPSLFRHYQIVQDTEGNHVELTRNEEQVNVMACDTVQMEFVHCHVLLKALTDRPRFEERGRQLQQIGHPLLARLTDFGEDEGNPFYITTHVDGETLQSYLRRQTELPGWLTVMVATSALEAVAALVSRIDLMPCNPLESLRLLQIGPQSLQVQVADYRLLSSGDKKVRGLPEDFAKQAELLRNFFADQSGGGSTLSAALLPTADFTELLNACLEAVAPENVLAIQSLREALFKLVPDKLAEEIPKAQKPRALLAQQLASYQEVARAVVNRIRIQSQRLDMANPYAMRGTLTKTGRQVLVEQVLPARLAPAVIAAAAEKAYRLNHKRDFPAILSVAFWHEIAGLTCVAEELAEGFTLADLLHERRALNVHEVYIVLAGLDGALTQLENSGLEAHRLRLEDIYLLTGFPRDDARSNRLLLTQLTDWPAFSVMLRAHPTLAAMSGRGTDPALILPLAKEGSRVWNASWLASVGRFLLALEPLPGAVILEAPANARETDSVARLLDDELAKARQGSASKRGDFLARYAQVVQLHDLAKPAVVPSESLELPRIKVSRTRTMVESREIAAPVPPLTTGLVPMEEKPSVGFAELLFHGSSEMSPDSGSDWVKTAGDAPPIIHPNESLLPPDEFVPFWLRAAVFIGGSMVLGGMIAHVSGDATWLKKDVSKPVQVMEKTVPKATPVTRAVPANAPSPRPDPAPDAPPAPGLGLTPPSGLKNALIGQ
jgi:hypothetical protein